VNPNREKKSGIKPKEAEGRRTKLKKEEKFSGEEPEENPREEKTISNRRF